MAKNLKINIKNTQIAQAINLTGVKDKLAKKKSDPSDTADAAATNVKEDKLPKDEQPKEESPRIKARSKSVFAAKTDAQEGEAVIEDAVPSSTAAHEPTSVEEDPVPAVEEVVVEEESPKKRAAKAKEEKGEEAPVVEEVKEPVHTPMQPPEPVIQVKKEEPAPTPPPAPAKEKEPVVERQAPVYHRPERTYQTPPPPAAHARPYEKLGPTGKHIKDLLPPKAPPRPPAHQAPRSDHRTDRDAPKNDAANAGDKGAGDAKGDSKDKAKVKTPGRRDAEEDTSQDDRRKGGGAKVKEFRDLKPVRKTESDRGFDARDRQGLRDGEDEQRGWRKKRQTKYKEVEEVIPDRPAQLSVRIPIAIKDLAAEMKLKASQLIGKLFLQGIVATLNDMLDDETTIQLLGHEFGCAITIDTTEERRIRVTEHSVKEEINQSPADQLQIRPPVVAFMGHVDHGKTSLIDYIRNSNRAAGEAGAITQHIGAFRCSTPVGDIAILDTPGHEAFSAMRARGADVTDIVVLVVAGDEGMRQQTVEAMNHAKAAGVTIVVAINKSDKPNFNQELVYRQLADNDLLPEAWGGQTITVNCSAVTGAGIPTLLEMLALQAEVLELKANPHGRARGRVLESEMHKGLGSVATVLVQNGTLKKNDSLVFGQRWGRVKTMRDEFGSELEEASPSTPVQITGLSGLPEAGQEFIVVKSEKEARDIAEARLQGQRQIALQQKKKLSVDNLVQQASESTKKVLNIILRADVQGSLEALKTAIMKIQSQKVDPNIIFSGVGEVSESDIQMAMTSKAIILGFHTQIESHAENLQKQYGVQIRMHDIIYHAIDDVKALMKALLDKIPQENEKGKAEVKATFKSSHHGVIAGCQVIEGSIVRSNPVRLRRGKEVVWKGQISSLKRVKEDVREVTKGLECGILLVNNNEILPEDIIESYEITYLTQEL